MPWGWGSLHTPCHGLREKPSGQQKEPALLPNWTFKRCHCCLQLYKAQFALVLLVRKHHFKLTFQLNEHLLDHFQTNEFVTKPNLFFFKGIFISQSTTCLTVGLRWALRIPVCRRKWLTAKYFYACNRSVHFIVAPELRSKDTGITKVSV